MAYATSADIQNRILRVLNTDEISLCNALLDDAALLIDSYNENAKADAKKVVSCRMVIRAIGSGDDMLPIGATQGTMSALGYSQTFTISGGGSVGQLYLDKTDKKLLGVGARIGNYSPVEEMVNAND